MLTLTSQQTSVLEELFRGGFEILSFPLYPNSVGVRKANCAALLVPEEGGGFRLLGSPSFLIDGQLSVRVSRSGKDLYVWKKKELMATPERIAEVDHFRAALLALLA